MDNLKTILIIDDTEANVNTLMELLEDKYDILASLDGKDGLEIVDEEKIDLILLDIMMPGIDGFEVCRRLKNNPKTKNIPVIFITAKTDEISIEKAYETGGVDYITKPFKAREVLSRINNHICLAQQKADLEQKVQAEVEKNIKKEVQLFESSKLAAMGGMIGNIIHQWKQPLSVISASVMNLELEATLNDTVSSEIVNEYTEEIIRGINRITETTETFRSYLKEKKERKKINLQKRIEQSLAISGTVLKNKGISLSQNIDNEHMIEIETVANELTEVIINIINNAMDAIEEKEIKKGWVNVELNIVGKMAVISIEDNGGGIGEDILPYIFNEYFTTKEEDKGTGLGLYMSHKIVTESLNGKLYAKNTQNGAKFFIELPLL